MRCFIAIDVSDEIKRKILPLQADLEKIADIKSVGMENLHVSLKFLGEVNDVSAVKSGMNKFSGSGPFDIKIAGLGVFPSMNYVRVVWLGVEGMKIKIDESDFHVTLGRVRSAKSKQELIEYIESNKNVEVGSMKVDEVKLKKSMLTPIGPVYEDIYSVNL